MVILCCIVAWKGVLVVTLDVVHFVKFFEQIEYRQSSIQSRLEWHLTCPYFKKLSQKCHFVLCLFKHWQGSHSHTCHRNVVNMPKSAKCQGKKTSKHAFFFFVCAIHLSCYKELKNVLKIKMTNFSLGHSLVCPTYADSLMKCVRHRHTVSKIYKHDINFVTYWWHVTNIFNTNFIFQIPDSIFYFKLEYYEDFTSKDTDLRSWTHVHLFIDLCWYLITWKSAIQFSVSQHSAKNPKLYIYYIYSSFHYFISFWDILIISYLEQYKRSLSARPKLMQTLKETGTPVKIFSSIS